MPYIAQIAVGKLERLAVFGADYPTIDGSGVRDYIHVEDLASAHVLALETVDDRQAMTYNLGNGQGYSVKQVIDVARAVTGHEIPAETTARRPGDGPMLVASAESVNDDLGWTPKYSSLNDIIASAWAWHQSHPHGYED